MKDRRPLYQKLWFGTFRASALLVLVLLGGFLAVLLLKGIGTLSWDFLTQPPRDGLTKGGIFPAIVGTAWLGVGAVIVAFPIGVASGIYLAFYAPQNAFTRLIRLSVNNLAGTPSIVFGLFGLATFVKALGLGVCVLSGILTLAAMVLPLIIRATEEALKSVPKDFIEASYALGATKFQTIWHVVLPSSFGWILTGVILALSRAAGETAPIMFTAATFYLTKPSFSPLSETMALPFHIYALVTEGLDPEVHTKMAYGTTVVLLALVLLLNLWAILHRRHLQKEKRW